MALVRPVLPIPTEIENLATRFVAGPSTTSAVPDPAVTAVLRPCPQCPDAASVLTWWVGPSELGFTLLDRDGAVLPAKSVLASGNARYPESLIQRAMHEARQ